jgi:hypothetical protein
MSLQFILHFKYKVISVMYAEFSLFSQQSIADNDLISL